MAWHSLVTFEVSADAAAEEQVLLPSASSALRCRSPNTIRETRERTPKPFDFSRLERQPSPQNEQPRQPSAPSSSGSPVFHRRPEYDFAGASVRKQVVSNISSELDGDAYEMVEPNGDNSEFYEVRLTFESICITHADVLQSVHPALPGQADSVRVAMWDGPVITRDHSHHEKVATSDF